MKVYVCHKFGGDDNNRKLVEEKIAKLYEKYEDVLIEYDFVFISPIHTFGFLYNSVSYDAGMKMCESLLHICDVLLCFGEDSDSKGCRIEKSICNEINIPIIEYEKFAILLPPSFQSLTD